MSIENVAEQGTTDISSPHDTQETAADQFENLLVDLGEEKNPAVGAGQNGEVPQEQPATGEQLEQLAPDSPEPELEAQGEAPVVEEEYHQNEAESFTIKVNGEEQSVTLDDLRSGYMQQSDYTRKTQELAQQRSVLEEQVGAATAERQQYANLLGAMEQQLLALRGAEPNWEQLAKDDPIGYVQQKERWNQSQQQIAAAQHERQRVGALQQEQDRQMIARAQHQQREMLLQVRPELNEPEKAKTFRNNLVNYAQHEYGLTANDLSQLLDHRAFLILDKARQFDELQKNGASVQQKVVRRKNPVVRPGASSGKVQVRSRGLRKARERLESTGDVRDAASAFENMLED